MTDMEEVTIRSPELFQLFDSMRKDPGNRFSLLPRELIVEVKSRWFQSRDTTSYERPPSTGMITCHISSLCVNSILLREFILSVEEENVSSALVKLFNTRQLVTFCTYNQWLDPNARLVLIHTFSGHTDSVRCVCFTPYAQRTNS